jgi:flavorubredoxin
MKVVVVYESRTGNTRRAAGEIALAARAAGADAVTYPADAVDYKRLAEADLVFVGSWTDGVFVAGQRHGGAGRIDRLPVLDRKPVAAFVTYALHAGKAVRKLAGHLAYKGGDVVATATFRRDRIPQGIDEFVAEAMEAVGRPVPA